MKHILARGQQAVLRRFARRNTLLALDYDGTLAPIVAEREQAHMRNRTRELLAQVTRRFPTVVITGRSRLDVMRFLAGVASLEVIGNHGLESEGVPATRFIRRVKDWRSVLAAQLQSLPGVLIEDKRYSLAVHYRQCEDKLAVLNTIRCAASMLDGVRTVGGKDVLNLVPQEAPDKGAALLAACARLGCARAIYVGDDDTDEDVFALNRPGHMLSIRVGIQRGSAAEFYLRDQGEMDEFLQALLICALPSRSVRERAAP